MNSQGLFLLTSVGLFWRDLLYLSSLMPLLCSQQMVAYFVVRASVVKEGFPAVSAALFCGDICGGNSQQPLPSLCID